LAVEVAGLLFKFNLVLPVFTLQGDHEILEIVDYVVVNRHVLLVHVLFTSQVLDLKVGLQEAVQCFLLVKLALNLERQFFEFLLVAPDTCFDLLDQRH
jgi:hypothetical protein